MPEYPAPSDETLRWVEDSMNPTAKVTKVRSIPSSSTAVHAVDMTVMGLHTRVVVRRFMNQERLASDPWYVPAHEAAAMRIVQGAAIRAPSLLAADFAPERCDAPTLLYSHLTGRPPSDQFEDMDGFTRQLAEALVAIHAIHLDGRPGDLPPYAAYTPPSELLVPPWTSVPEAWKDLLAAAAEPAPDTDAGFIHRDYHPGNTLWRKDGTLSGVVDWTTGSWGPRAIDVCHMRQNLVWSYSQEAADSFLAHYELLSGNPVANLDYWDRACVADGTTEDDQPLGPEDAPKIARFDAWVPTLL